MRPRISLWLCSIAIGQALLFTIPAMVTAADGGSLHVVKLTMLPPSNTAPPEAGDYRTPAPIAPNNCVGYGSVNFANNPSAAVSTGLGAFDCSFEWLNPPYPNVDVHVEIHDISYAQGLMSGNIYTQANNSGFEQPETSALLPPFAFNTWPSAVELWVQVTATMTNGDIWATPGPGCQYGTFWGGGPPELWVMTCNQYYEITVQPNTQQGEYSVQ